MKNIFAITVMGLLLGLSASAQKMEVLYFKADMACCRARACDALESDIKSIFEINYKNENVQFTSVRISDPANKALVEKYKAGSQTVVVVTTHRRNETSRDISAIVRNYTRNRDKAGFEKELLAQLSDNAK